MAADVDEANSTFGHEASRESNRGAEQLRSLLDASTPSASSKAPSAGPHQRCRPPDQADRWTWLVVAAYTQLRLARELVDDQRLPWERPRDPTKLTPARVRRGFRRLHPTLGTPASAPKSDRPGPGRPKNTRRPPRTRYPAVKKAA